MAYLCFIYIKEQNKVLKWTKQGFEVQWIKSIVKLMLNRVSEYYAVCIRIKVSKYYDHCKDKPRPKIMTRTILGPKLWLL